MINRTSVFAIFIVGVVAGGFIHADEEQSPPEMSKRAMRDYKYIETYYERRIAELKRRADRRARKMEKVENRKLKEQALIERERRLDYWGFANPETLTSLEQQEATKYRIAEGAKAIETKLALAIERMEKRKEADLQRLTVRAAIVQATVAAPPKPVRGVVCGVASSDDTAMILIGNKIYNVGDTIDGVEITEIDLNEVEFERDGERWSQRLQEPADSRWKLLTP